MEVEALVMEKVEVTIHFEPTDKPGTILMRLSPQNLELVRELVKQHPDMKSRARVTFQPYDEIEQAKKLFFVIRDRILEAQSGMWSKQEADQLKDQLKEEFGARVNGKLKSLSDKAQEKYTKGELWLLNQGAMQWAEEMGADVHDLLPDYYEQQA